MGEEIDYALQSLHAIGTRYKATVDASNESGNAESAAASSHYVCIVLGIYAIEVYAFGSQSRVWLSSIPHIIKVYALDVVEHCIVRFETVGALYACQHSVVSADAAFHWVADRSCGWEHKHLQRDKK